MENTSKSECFEDESFPLLNLPEFKNSKSKIVLKAKVIIQSIQLILKVIILPDYDHQSINSLIS
jgi:hypothetical protein